MNVLGMKYRGHHSKLRSTKSYPPDNLLSQKCYSASVVRIADTSEIDLNGNFSVSVIAKTRTVSISYHAQD
jgi:hypothetical protein